MATKDDSTLNDKQKRFCEEYVIDWNATRAAIAAGYSEHTAKQMGYENLTKPYISEYIEKIQEDLAKLAGLSALSNLKELKTILTTKKEQTKDKIRAIEVINKMLDFNTPEKTEQKISIDTLSPEERKAEIERLYKKMKGND